MVVGDNLAMTAYGNASTIPATMDMMIMHAQAVRRGPPSTFCLGCMPYQSYNTVGRALSNAMRFMQEAGCDHGMPNHLRRLQEAKREQGWSTAEEISKVLGISVGALRERSRRGTWVERHAFTIGTRPFSMYRLLDDAKCERTREPQTDHSGNGHGHGMTREAS